MTLERATVAQQVQLRVETTPGTDPGGGGTKLLTALGFDISPEFNITEFTPTGLKYATIVALLQEWSKFGLSGYPTYTEIVYPLSSILVAATPSTTTGVTTWTFTPSTGSPDTVKTFTLERGNSVQAEKMTYALLSEFGINFSPTQAGLTGSGFGQKMSLGATMTGSPATIALQPILPTHVQVSLDTSSANLGNTVLTRVLSIGWSLSNRQGPLWVVNSANTSFASVVELKPEAKIDISMEMDANGVVPITDLRAGTVKWMRIKATGPNIPASTPTTPFSLQIDGPVEVVSVGGSGDQDGVYKIDFTLRLLHDGTWGQAMQVIVKNNITAL